MTLPKEHYCVTPRPVSTPHSSTPVTSKLIASRLIQIPMLYAFPLSNPTEIGVVVIVLVTVDLPSLKFESVVSTVYVTYIKTQPLTMWAGKESNLLCGSIDFGLCQFQYIYLV